MMHVPLGCCKSGTWGCRVTSGEGIDSGTGLDSRIGSGWAVLVRDHFTITGCPVYSLINFIYLSNLIPLGSSPTKQNPQQVISKDRKSWHREFDRTGHLRQSRGLNHCCHTQKHRAFVASGDMECRFHSSMRPTWKRRSGNLPSFSIFLSGNSAISS
jgi:hypothetical protein